MNRYLLPISDSKTAPNRMEHIEGLRALAIMGVCLFHYLKLFPNGYLGVDIFLVISGYLLFRNFWTDKQDFNFFSFVKKKVIRLWPACIAISLLCSLSALVFLPHHTFLQTAYGSIASLLGGANLYYDYSSDGYFTALSSVQHPLVHTWYLSLIAQVYLLSGIVIGVCKHLSYKAKAILLALLCACSCCICYLPMIVDAATPLHSEFSTYYWTSGRLWMVFSGALVPLLPEWRTGGTAKPVVGAASLACLFAVVFYIHPYFSSLLPEVFTVTCTVVCLKYGTVGVCSRILGHPVCVTIGKYSFSIYLVHWPILVFFASYTLEWQGNIPAKAAALFCSAVAALLFYHLVEKRRFSTSRIGLCWVASLAALLFLANSSAIHHLFHKEVDGVWKQTRNDSRILPELKSGRLYETLPKFRRLNYRGGVMNSLVSLERIPLLYRLGDEQREPNFILIGDSHASSLSKSFCEMSKRNHWCGAFLNTYITPVDNYFWGPVYCQRWDADKAEMLLEYLRNNPQIDTVIISNHWKNRAVLNYREFDGTLIDVHEQPTLIFEKIRSYMLKIRDCGKRVIILTDVPRFTKIKDPVGYFVKHKMLQAPVDESLFTCTREAYDEMNGDLNTLFDRLEDEGVCKTIHMENVFFQNGTASFFNGPMLLYKDQHHLTAQGADMALHAVEDQLRKLLNPVSIQTEAR